MAVSLWRICNNFNKKVNIQSIGSIRNGHHLRGKPPMFARNLQQRLEELNREDPSLHFKVDIGLPPPKQLNPNQLKERLEHYKKQRRDPKLEQLARQQKLLIDMDEAWNEWIKTNGPAHIRTICEHYDVYKHLFGDAYFYPYVPLRVHYLNELVHPVYFGNIIKPSDATRQPEIEYECDDNSLWTLILTNPDGHFTDTEKEYVHWFVGNIPGNRVDKGETIVEYLQPFPPKGTGFHRHIFVLYKQNEKIDFTEYKKVGACYNLSERTFSTLDFYRSRQDKITPASLAFYQSDWDKSLTNFYHNTLNMKEPIFEYDFPEPFIRKQKWFAKKQPFNLYMDKYRDPKQINKEYLMKKLKESHPFRPPEKELPYPNAQYFEGYIPSWLKLEMRKNRLKWGRINDIE